MDGRQFTPAPARPRGVGAAGGADGARPRRASFAIPTVPASVNKRRRVAEHIREKNTLRLLVRHASKGIPPFTDRDSVRIRFTFHGARDGSNHVKKLTDALVWCGLIVDDRYPFVFEEVQRARPLGDASSPWTLVEIEAVMG